MQNGIATLENSLAVVIKLNIHLTYDPTIPLLGIYFSEMKTYIHTKKLSMIVYSSSIHNHSKLEIVQLSFNS